MTSMYKLGAAKALEEMGLEKKANPLLRSLGIGAARGGLLGGAAGALGADEGHRGAGFMRGALAGGALGAGAGAGIRGLERAGAAFRGAGLASTGNMLRRPVATGLGVAGGIGALGAGYGAGSTAQQSPLEKFRGMIPGLG